MAQALVVPFAQPAMMVVHRDGLIFRTGLLLFDGNLAILLVHDVIDLGEHGEGFVLGIGDVMIGGFSGF